MSVVKTLSGFYPLKQANTLERISEDKNAFFNRLWLYPSTGVVKVAGALQIGQLNLNVGAVYVGEDTQSEKATPDILNINDPPILIELPHGESKALRDVLIQGANVGDGVWFKYWPALPSKTSP